MSNWNYDYLIRATLITLWQLHQLDFLNFLRRRRPYLLLFHFRDEVEVQTLVTLTASQVGFWGFPSP